MSDRQLWGVWLAEYESPEDGERLIRRSCDYVTHDREDAEEVAAEIGALTSRIHAWVAPVEIESRKLRR